MQARATRRLAVSIIGICAIAAAPALAQGAIVFEKSFAVQSEPIRVQITDDAGMPVSGATVEVTYRPGSSVERTDPVGATSSDGSISWTPQDAGLATVSATWTAVSGEELSNNDTISVKFRTPPIDGIIIMIVAGLVLIGGSVVRITNLMSTPDLN